MGDAPSTRLAGCHAVFSRVRQPQRSPLAHEAVLPPNKLRSDGKSRPSPEILGDGHHGLKRTRFAVRELMSSRKD
jgi:hypothetical protein